MLTTKIKFLKATKMIKISVCTGIIVFIISNIISIAIEIKINEKINKFEIDKKIIAPYINDKELIILESQFHQMKNQKDYNDVYMKINNIKKINGVITAK